MLLKIYMILPTCDSSKKKKAWIFSTSNEFITLSLNTKKTTITSTHPQNIADYTHQTFLIITKIVSDWAFILAKFLFLLNMEQIVYNLEMSLEQTVESY